MINIRAQIALLVLCLAVGAMVAIVGVPPGPGATLKREPKIVTLKTRNHDVRTLMEGGQ